MQRTFYSSIKKAFVAYSFIVLLLAVGFGFHNWRFELVGFGWGALFGAILGLFVFILGSQKISINNNYVTCGNSLFTMVSKKFGKSLELLKIREVRLGTPRFNNVATFAAINIATDNEEITFNPDLFKVSTLQNLFKELKLKNPHISFDNYSTTVMNGQSGQKIFAKRVLKTFTLIVILILTIPIIPITLYKLRIISGSQTMILLGVLLFCSPFIYNGLSHLASKFRLNPSSQ